MRDLISKGAPHLGFLEIRCSKNGLPSSRLATTSNSDLALKMYIVGCYLLRAMDMETCHRSIQITSAVGMLNLYASREVSEQLIAPIEMGHSEEAFTLRAPWVLCIYHFQMSSRVGLIVSMAHVGR